MFGRFNLIFCFVFLFLGFHAVVLAAPLASMDSIGIQKVGDRTFIVHQVVGQETLFSVSRRYKVSMSEIQQANESLKQGMKDGQTLLVPFGQSSSSSSAPVSTPSAGLASVPTANNTPVQTQITETTAKQATDKVALEPEGTTNTPVKNEKPTAVTPTEPVVATTSKPAAEVTIQKVKSTHKVKSGENLSSIAKKYKVTVAELKSWNSLKSDRVMIGQSLKIISKQAVAVKQSNTEPKAEPLAAKTAVNEEVKKEEPKVASQKADVPNENKEVVFVSTKASTVTAKASGDWTSHTVKAGESLFSLSKQYGSSIEELIQWNALTSNNLKVGQSIKVGRATSESTAVPVVAELKSQPTTIATPVQQPQETTVPNTSTNTSGGFTNTKESGLAEVIPGTEASKKYLVLHRNAPVGSVIRVKNEENDLTIFARVVGVLPETGDNSKVLIKLSQAAFEQLKGVNTRFPVEILY
jgi:LysM repeat protein